MMNIETDEQEKVKSTLKWCRKIKCQKFKIEILNFADNFWQRFDYWLLVIKIDKPFDN